MRGPVRERAGRLSPPWLPAPISLGRAQPQSRSSCAAGAAVLGGGEERGRAGVNGITGRFVSGYPGHRLRPQPWIVTARLEAVPGRQGIPDARNVQPACTWPAMAFCPTFSVGPGPVPCVSEMKVCFNKLLTYKRVGKGEGSIGHSVRFLK